MGNLGSASVIPHLEDSLRHRSPNVVSAALRSLGMVNHPNAAMALLRHFHNASTVDTRARIQVLKALQRHDCSYQALYSIFSDGLKLLGSPISRDNETCHKLCAIHCRVRNPIKCSNFCTHRCSHRIKFKAELGTFLYSTRSSGNLQNLVEDAFSSGHWEGLSNLGMLPDSNEPLILRIQAHNPFHWEKKFGTSVIGANLRVHLENGIRLWLSTFGRSMQAVVDNSFSASVHAWIKEMTIFDIGIELEMRFSSLQPTPPDLLSSLSEWEVHIHADPYHVLQALWNVSSRLVIMNRSDSFRGLIDRHGIRGHEDAIQLCRLSKTIANVFSESMELQSLDTFDQVDERLQKLNQYMNSTSSDIMRALTSARNKIEESSIILPLSSMSLALKETGIWSNMDEINRLSDLILSSNLVDKMFHAIEKVRLDVDMPALKRSVFSLNKFTRRSAVLLKSRYWGASIQDNFLEPVVDSLRVRFKKPSPWTGNCLRNWILRAHNVFTHNTSSSPTKLVPSWCENLDLTTPSEVHCCSDAIICYATCHHNKASCDAAFEECVSVVNPASKNRMAFRLRSPWKIFSGVRRSHCVCQREYVRPSKITGDCPQFFVQSAADKCDPAIMEKDSSPELNLPSTDQNWESAAGVAIQEFSLFNDTSSKQVQSILSEFLHVSNPNQSTFAASYADLLNVSQKITSLFENRDISNDSFLLFGLSQSPRPFPESNPYASRLFEAVMSLSLWNGQGSELRMILKENQRALQIIRNRMLEASTTPHLVSKIRFSEFLVGVLEEENSMLESARNIKYVGREITRARDMVQAVTLKAMRDVAQAAADKKPGLVEAFSGLTISDRGAISNITMRLEQREQILQSIQDKLLPSGL